MILSKRLSMAHRVKSQPWAESADARDVNVWLKSEANPTRVRQLKIG
jgi:hypothetical protein